MTVYCNCGLSPEYGVRNDYIIDYFSGLVYHFQDLNFGNGVKEIVYYLASGGKDFLRFIGTGTVYKKKSKTIGCGFFVDFETAKRLEIEALLPYMSLQLIEESKNFSKMHIKDFDLESYIICLEKYFSEAMQTMINGKKPGEGKTLNEDIQISMTKKWSKL